MDKETELYFRNFTELFRSQGWQQFTDEIKANVAATNNIELTKDEQDLYFRKGQLAVMANILNLETQVEAAREQANENVEDI